MTLSTAPNDHHTDVNHERTSTTEGHLAHHDDEPVLNTPMIAANNNVIRPQYEYDYAFVKKDRSDSQGSHGSHDHESGLKKVWHKVSDKVHPYNTAVEKDSLDKDHHHKDSVDQDLNQEKKERRRSNGGYV